MGDQKTLSPEIESAKEARRRRQAIWSAVGAVLASFTLSLLSQMQSCYARQDSEKAKQEAKAQATAATRAAVSASSAHISSTVTEAQMRAAYDDVLEKFDELDNRLEWQDKRTELLERLVVTALGNRRAVRNYAPPAPVTKQKKQLPKSPREALQQKVMKDPRAIFAD